MNRDRTSLRLISFLTLILLGTASSFAASKGPVGFLTGPQDGEPYELAMGFVQGNLDELGLQSGDLADFVIKNMYQTRHNGTTHIYLQQRLDGVDVYNGILNVNVARDGSIINVGSRFVSGLASKANAHSPELEDRVAIQKAAEHLGVADKIGSLTLLGGEGSRDLEARYSKAGISRDEIPVRLVYQPTEDGRVRLAWETRIRMIDTPDWWNVRVDATTGEVLSQNNWTSYDSYNVIPFPAFSDPDDSGGQVVVTDPADPIASEFGWHDTDGDVDADFTDTRGNNVNAQDDLDNNNSGGLHPDGGAGLDFLFPWDPDLDPEGGTNLEAAITNLFYVNNVMHDLTYQYGFDEVAGNFQFNNYGNGGSGGDQVEADALDGSGTNNANFLTPPDGTSGRMQMFRWTGVENALVTVNSPGPIAGDYAAATSTFGPAPGTPGVTGDVEEVNDMSTGDGTGTFTDGCEALVGFTSGNIALIDRGTCNFDDKVGNAETAGATAVIIVNDRPGILNPGGTPPPVVTIPSVLVRQEDGEMIRAELLTEGGGVNVTIRDDPDPPPDRDSDFDNGVIAHEYGHGISNRLTGGPGTAGCLFGDEQAGEGWSDFWTLMLTAKPSDLPHTPKGVGNYLIFEGGNGPGIRNFPYSTDLTTNPQTYGDIAATNVPHGVGEIWMAMVWEMYWELVAEYGFDEDFYNGTGGNNLTIQLVIDGMKLQNCGPTFVDARDAILLADANNNGGANECEIWRAFAKRGLGMSASAGGVGVDDETEAFDIPEECSPFPNFIFTDGFETGDATRWDAQFPAP